MQGSRELHYATSKLIEILVPVVVVASFKNGFCMFKHLPWIYDNQPEIYTEYRIVENNSLDHTSLS